MSSTYQDSHSASARSSTPPVSEPNQGSWNGLGLSTENAPVPRSGAARTMGRTLAFFGLRYFGDIGGPPLPSEPRVRSYGDRSTSGCGLRRYRIRGECSGPEPGGGSG